MTSLLRLPGPGQRWWIYGWRDWGVLVEHIESDADLRARILCAVDDAPTFVRAQSVARSVEARIAATAALSEDHG